MRRKFLSIGLALVLSMGLATAAVADTDGSVTAQEQTNADNDNGDTGLWGLLGLLGLAGLAGLKRDDRHSATSQTTLSRDNQQASELNR